MTESVSKTIHDVAQKISPISQSNPIQLSTVQASQSAPSCPSESIQVRRKGRKAPNKSETPRRRGRKPASVLPGSASQDPKLNQAQNKSGDSLENNATVMENKQESDAQECGNIDHAQALEGHYPGGLSGQDLKIKEQSAYSSQSKQPTSLSTMPDSIDGSSGKSPSLGRIQTADINDVARVMKEVFSGTCSSMSKVDESSSIDTATVPISSKELFVTKNHCSENEISGGSPSRDAGHDSSAKAPGARAGSKGEENSALFDQAPVPMADDFDIGQKTATVSNDKVEGSSKGSPASDHILIGNSTLTSKAQVSTSLLSVAAVEPQGITLASPGESSSEELLTAPGYVSIDKCNKQCGSEDGGKVKEDDGVLVSKTEGCDTKSRATAPYGEKVEDPLQLTNESSKLSSIVGVICVVPQDAIHTTCISTQGPEALDSVSSVIGSRNFGSEVAFPSVSPGELEPLSVTRTNAEKDSELTSEKSPAYTGFYPQSERYEAQSGSDSGAKLEEKTVYEPDACEPKSKWTTMSEENIVKPGQMSENLILGSVPVDTARENTVSTNESRPPDGVGSDNGAEVSSIRVTMPLVLPFKIEPPAIIANNAQKESEPLPVQFPAASGFGHPSVKGDKRTESGHSGHEVDKSKILTPETDINGIDPAIITTTSSMNESRPPSDESTPAPGIGLLPHDTCERRPGSEGGMILDEDNLVFVSGTDSVAHKDKTSARSNENMADGGELCNEDSIVKSAVNIIPSAIFNDHQEAGLGLDLPNDRCDTRSGSEAGGLLCSENSGVGSAIEIIPIVALFPNQENVPMPEATSDGVPTGSIAEASSSRELDVFAPPLSAGQKDVSSEGLPSDGTLSGSHTVASRSQIGSPIHLTDALETLGETMTSSGDTVKPSSEHILVAPGFDVSIDEFNRRSEIEAGIEVKKDDEELVSKNNGCATESIPDAPSAEKMEDPGQGTCKSSKLSSDMEVVCEVPLDSFQRTDVSIRGPPVLDAVPTGVGSGDFSSQVGLPLVSPDVSEPLGITQTNIGKRSGFSSEASPADAGFSLPVEKYELQSVSDSGAKLDEEMALVPKTDDCKSKSKPTADEPSTPDGLGTENDDGASSTHVSSPLVLRETMDAPRVIDNDSGSETKPSLFEFPVASIESDNQPECGLKLEEDKVFVHETSSLELENRANAKSDGNMAEPSLPASTVASHSCHPSVEGGLESGLEVQEEEKGLLPQTGAEEREVKAAPMSDENTTTPVLPASSGVECEKQPEIESRPKEEENKILATESSCVKEAGQPQYGSEDAVVVEEVSSSDA